MKSSSILAKEEGIYRQVLRYRGWWGFLIDVAGGWVNWYGQGNRWSWSCRFGSSCKEDEIYSCSCIMWFLLGR